jgi:hypothetical protein
MADFDSSLPIRSEKDGLDERVHIKIFDGTVSPAVNAVEVDSDSNLHVEIHGNDPTSADKVVRLSELGALTPDGVYDVANNTKPGNSGVVASVRNATPSDATQTQRVTAVTLATVRALDVSMHDENGAAYSVTNPLPVFVSETEGGVPVHEFDSEASVAINASVNLDYTVPAGKTLKLWQVLASASGKIKVELQIDTGAGLVTKAVYFNSTSDTNIETAWSMPMTVAAGLKARLIITNRDKQPFDVFGTFVGVLS